MKQLMKLLAVALTVCLAISSLPLSFATEESADTIVQQDYENYLATGGVDESELVEGTDYVAGEVLFNILGANNQTAAIRSVEKDFGLEVLEVIDQTALASNATLSSIGAPSETLCRASFDNEKMSVFELCKALNAQDNIKDAEPNYTYAPESFSMPTEISGSSSYSSMQKWYFDVMNLTNAWQTHQTLGENTVVCVIDCGLNYEHNEIKDRLWDDGNGHYGYNAEFNNNDIYGQAPEGPEHGSHCAGIIAMQANNGGLVGVAPKTKIMTCNAVTSATGYFTNANLIKSLEYAVAHGADVISMSLGGYMFSLNMEKALARASKSAVILCAAGNEGLNAATRLHYPSASSAVIGVMALGDGTYKNRLSDYSNYDLTGKYYQVAAPGTAIYSIAAKSNTSYVRMSGTSMATPFMAGIAALYISAHPDLSPTEARHAIVEAAGEMVRGYASDALTYSFKKATPVTLLGETPAPAQTVAMTDRLLSNAVHTALGMENYESLTNYDLESVSYLDLSDTTFKNYASLTAVPKLTSLSLANTDMSEDDAMQLASYLPDTLLNIDFSGNALTSLDIFENYDGFISRLVVANNAIRDISGISGFTMLSDLDISANKIKNISTVSSLSGLVYLYCPGNLIEDADPIIDLDMLEEVYFGNYNPSFTDMFGELYFLSGEKGNHIASLEPFMRLTRYSRLHYINLSYNFVNHDPQYNYRTAKLLQIMSDIAKYHDFKSVFAESVGYKLVISPFAASEMIPAENIVFTGDNFATVYLNGEGYPIPYEVTPANANYQTDVTFTISNEDIAYVSDEGVIYPKKIGSAYVTLTLAAGKVKTFFVTVSETFVASAGIYNPSSSYAAQTAYTAIIYTAPCEEIILFDQNNNSFGQYSAEGKYCFAMTDAHGNAFQRWLVPLYAQTAGEYTVNVKARAKKSDTFSDTIGSFAFPVNEKFGHEVTGALGAYTTRLDTVVSIFAADDTLIQTQTVKGGTMAYRFTNIPDGIYTIKIERDGYLPYYFKNIAVFGDVYVDDNIDISNSFDNCAGDFNADEVIDIADITVLLSDENFGLSTASAQSLACDIDGDESVNIQDLAIVIANI